MSKDNLPAKIRYHTLFVYGTLKRGFGNSPLMVSAKYIGNAFVPGWKLSSVGGCFPAATPNVGSSIYGEVYEVRESDLEAIDCLEGEGILYNRVTDGCLMQDRTIPDRPVELYAWNGSLGLDELPPKEGTIYEWKHEDSIFYQSASIVINDSTEPDPKSSKKSKNKRKKSPRHDKPVTFYCAMCHNDEYVLDCLEGTYELCPSCHGTCNGT